MYIYNARSPIHDGRAACFRIFVTNLVETLMKRELSIIGFLILLTNYFIDFNWWCKQVVKKGVLEVHAYLKKPCFAAEPKTKFSIAL